MTLIDEIFGQVESLERSIDRNISAADEIAETWRTEGFDHVIIAARGTSDNAARYAQYVWGAKNQLSVGLATPSLFSVYDQPPSLGNSAVVGISQSGESPDIVAVLHAANLQNLPTLAITNEGSSPLAEEADRTILLHVGKEESIAATKTYTAELVVVALISAAMSGEEEARHAIAQVPAHVDFMLGQSDHIAQIAREYSVSDRCSVIGRGFNQATAFEWALKLQELAYLSALPFSSADFLHGPIAMVEPGYPVFAVAADGPTHDDVRSILLELVERDVDVVVVSNRDDTLALSASTISLPPTAPEWITPIPAIVGAQLFTYHLTVAKGLDPDRPRGLTKVVRTV